MTGDVIRVDPGSAVAPLHDVGNHPIPERHLTQTALRREPNEERPLPSPAAVSHARSARTGQASARCRRRRCDGPFSAFHHGATTFYWELSLRRGPDDTGSCGHDAHERTSRPPRNAASTRVTIPERSAARRHAAYAALASIRSNRRSSREAVVATLEPVARSARAG